MIIVLIAAHLPAHLPTSPTSLLNWSSYALMERSAEISYMCVYCVAAKVSEEVGGGVNIGNSTGQCQRDMCTCMEIGVFKVSWHQARGPKVMPLH